MRRFFLAGSVSTGVLLVGVVGLGPGCSGSVAAFDDGDIPTSDAGIIDTGPDTSVPDSGLPDAAQPDASVPDTSAPDTGKADTGAPDVSVPDAGVPDGVQCGSSKCAVGQVCCPSSLNGQIILSCAASCPTGNTLECDGPEDCSGKLCCGKTTTNAGVFPNCPVSAASSKCEASCSTNVATSCSATSTVRLCHAKADCTEPANNNCCTFEYGGNAQTFCVSSLFAFGAKSCAK